MNARALTVSALSHLGQPRARQTVHVLITRHGGGLGPRYTVLVDGEYYDCGQHVLDKLKAGSTPSYLEIEPCNPEDDFSDGEF